MTNRIARLAGATALAVATLASTAVSGVPEAHASTAQVMSYARTFNGRAKIGKYVMNSHRDPVHPGVDYSEDDPRWNCFLDGNQYCDGALSIARGMISKHQAHVFTQRFHHDDLCLFAPNDPYGAIWCRDGRTYITPGKGVVQA